MKFYYLVIAAVAFLAYVSTDSCIQCNSNEDQRCAYIPEVFLAKDCRNTSDICYVRVTVDGVTYRGCASDLDNATLSRCNNERECLTCKFLEGCNRGVFPQHRLQCVVCEGNSTSSSCATNTFARARACPLYKFGDSCFIRNTGKNGTDGSFQRGCLSSAIVNKTCVDRKNCYVCDGAGCNNLAPEDFNIPLARDAAPVLGYSTLMILGALLLRRFI